MKLLEQINSKIDSINQSIAWIKAHRKDQFEQRYSALIEERRKLRILATAESNNPGIAAFGQSQVGKSYLMNCILQNPDSPFLVDGGGCKHNFVDEINPIGEGQEATGVVTRFSSYQRNEAMYNEAYPIRMRVMSVRDVLMVLCDTYYNEFNDYEAPSEDEIVRWCDELKHKYGNRESQNHPALLPDDVLDMKQYFVKHINNASVFVKKSFFDTLALLVERVPIDDYVSLFAFLWHRESVYTDLFKHALDILRRLRFESHVYLPIESVLHEGKKENTIMSVSCLKLLGLEQESAFSTKAYTFDKEQHLVNLGDFTKSELCLVCFEVVIRISREFYATSGKYEITEMEPSTREKLLRGGNIVEQSSDVPTPGSKWLVLQEPLKVLEKTDLLDFPGARARGNMRLEQVRDHDNLMYSILRGKVAYLFNQYNEEKIINILLFCHHHKNVEAPQMWQLIDDWVKEYVGDTPQKRADYIRLLGVPPLFHIGTMFNLNLKSPDNATLGKSDASIYSRWKGRFMEKLIEECFKKADWVKNWTGIDEPFQNCYMLRDFKFSTDIYQGWNEKNPMECKLSIDEDYLHRMKIQFIACNQEHRLFADPELSWDVASTRNNDGSLYILQQLAIVSAKIDEAREKQISDLLQHASERIYAMMKDYYISTDVTEILNANIRKASAICAELDIMCNNDNYYFGHLIQALQFKESTSYREVHRIIQSPELNDEVNTFKEYQTIRNRCKECGYDIDRATNEDERWNCLLKSYLFLESRSQAEAYLQRKGVDVKKLFAGSDKRKCNSCIIADTVFERWSKTIKSTDFMNEFTSEFDAGVMSNLINDFIDTAQKMHLSDVMAHAIANYVDVVNIHTANENLLADLLADIINKFVLDFGFDLLSDEAKQAAQHRCEQYHIPAFKQINKTVPAEVDEAVLTQLFNDMSVNPQALHPSFNENYNKWMEYMFISFVAHLDVPDNFDHEANQALQHLLEKLQCAA